MKFVEIEDTKKMAQDIMETWCETYQKSEHEFYQWFSEKGNASEEEMMKKLYQMVNL